MNKAHAKRYFFFTTASRWADFRHPWRGPELRHSGVGPLI